MKRKSLVIALLSLLLLAGCGWHMPFFGDKDKKAEQDQPVVQETGSQNEQPQYSGVNNNMNQPPAYPAPGQPGAPPAPNSPYNAYNYGVQSAPAYPGAPAAYPGAQPGMPPAPPVPGAPPAPGAYGAPPAVPPVPGQYPAAPVPAAAPYGAPPAPAPLAAPGAALVPGAAPGSNPFETPGIKRKAIYMVSYPNRGLTTAPLDNFSQQIYTALSNTSGLLLLPRESVNSYLSSHQLFTDAMDKKSKLVKLGQDLGVQVIIYEKVNFQGQPQPGGEGNYQVQLEVIDVSSGYPLKSYAIQGNTYAATPPVDQVVADLGRNIKLIDWYCRVVKIDRRRIYLNAGRLTGLQMGQKLKVYAKGSVIKDPTTKMSLGKAQGALKGIVKITDFFGMDGAICEPVSGKGFAVNDMVKAVE
ncbi:MAG: hypothetical protein JRJ56_06385 [Deltaproteobacteria bacterium]|jgi:hypothetical protein|nr:hypothetical protein [Deltaproteobacteria bacterium]